MSSFDNDPMRNLPLVTPPQTANKRAAGWQIIATAIGAIVIVMMFLWGINNQRDETAGQPTAATQTAPAQPAGDQQEGAQPPEKQQQGANNASATTGQGSRQDGEAAQKANSEQTTNHQQNSPDQNQPAIENNGQSAQPQQQ